VLPTQSLPILLADQDDHSRNRLAGVLRDEGFETLPARTGGEAVEVVRTRLVGITILDVALPDLSGIETFELISSVRRGVPGIFMARERSKETLARLLDAGAFTVLHKPPSIAVLLEAVRRLASRITKDRPF
jgi:DNA-binding response OmpR family regulator